MESAEMISPENARAQARASADLPDAVGPMMTGNGSMSILFLCAFRAQDRGDDKQRNAAGDADIRDVERRPLITADVEQEEIDDFPAENAVGAVARDARTDGEQGKNALRIPVGEFAEKNDYSRERRKRDCEQQPLPHQPSP